MNKQNNCPCVVCNVEAALLDSFSTQTARNHFKALASNYPVLSHFQSPLEAVAKLHEQGESVNHDAGNQILHGAQDIVRTAQDGHVDDALHKLSDLQKMVDELVQTGKITSASRAAAIRNAVHALGQTLQTAP